MDKLAAYGSLLAGHPLWRGDHLKESSYSTTLAATGAGALGGAGLGYAAKREGSARDRVRGAAHGALLGGSVGFTGGELYRLSKAHQGREQALNAAHKLEMGKLRQRRARDDQKHAREMADIRGRTQKLRRAKDDLDRLFVNGKLSVEELDRFMTE